MKPARSGNFRGALAKNACPTSSPPGFHSHQISEQYRVEGAGFQASPNSTISYSSKRITYQLEEHHVYQGGSSVTAKSTTNSRPRLANFTLQSSKTKQYQKDAQRNPRQRTSTMSSQHHAIMFRGPIPNSSAVCQNSKQNKNTLNIKSTRQPK